MKWRPPNPIALLFGPIFQKEVRAMGRRRSTYLARSFVALGLTAIVSMFFLIFLVENSAGLHRLQSLQSLAPTLTFVVVWFQFIILGLMAPMLTADAISEERKSQTLSTLLTTPLTASQIVFGKLSSRLVQVLILALISLPLLLSIRIFGGVSANLLLAATSIILSVAILGAALGLLFSLWSRIGGRASAAATQATLILLLIQFGPWIADSLRVHLLRTVAIPAAPIPDIDATSAPFVMGAMTLSTIMGTGIRSVELTLWPTTVTIPIGPIWLANTLYNLAAALLVACMTSLFLRRAMRRLVNEAPPARRAKRRLFARRPAPALAAPTGGDAQPSAVPSLPAETTRTASRTLRGNPILWRELRQPVLGSRRRLVLAAIAVVISYALLYWSVDIFDDSGVHMFIAVLGAMVLLAQAAYASSASIAGERDARTWDALLATPMTARQIVQAKFAGALRSQWVFLAAVLIHFLLIAMLRATRPGLPLQMALILIGPMILLTATGQFFALAFRRGITAAAVNLILAFTLYAGVWVAMGSLALLLQGDDPLWFRRLADIVYATHPFTLFAAAIENSFWRRTTGYDLMYASLTSGQFNLLVVLVLLGNLALAAATLWLACRTFPWFTGRTS